MPKEALPDDRWAFECQIRERELALEERRLQHEISAGGRREGWSNPLVVAVFAAAVAAIGNAVVTYVEGVQSRQLEAFQSQQTNALEEKRAEFARIQKMLETGDPDTAADNLQFLMDVGLISNPDIKVGLEGYLSDRTPGRGVALRAVDERTAFFANSPERDVVAAEFRMGPRHIATLSEAYRHLTARGFCPEDLSRLTLVAGIPTASECIGRLMDASADEVLDAIRLAPDKFLYWIQTNDVPPEWRELIGLPKEP